jgi:short-subunit dehydrogenase
MDAECLRRERHFANLLDPSGFGRERRGRTQQLGTITGGDCQLEARKKDAHNHERMFPSRADGPCSDARCYGPAMASTPNIADIAVKGAHTLRAFGQRVPGAGGLLARSLRDSLKERNVLITGASSGIGKATALEIGKAQGTVLLVARTKEKLDEVAAEVEELGGVAYVHPCDLSDLDDIDRMAAEVLEEHSVVDILVNNAGKSIRRSVSNAYDRFHDYQRTMQLNYFAPVKLILALLPAMRAQHSGHIINISTIGLQMNTPRFSAYVASKAALDAFSRSIAPEVIGDGVHVTTVYMPLVRTPMIAPTKIYDRFPTLSPEEAAEMITASIRKRPKRVATTMGNLGQLSYAVVPGAQDLVVNRAYKLFPEGAPKKEEESAEQRAFARATRGVHW